MAQCVQSAKREKPTNKNTLPRTGFCSDLMEKCRFPKILIFIIVFGLRAYILSSGKLLSVIFCDLTSLLSFYQPRHNQSSTITDSQLLNNYYLLVVLSSKNSVP